MAIRLRAACLAVAVHVTLTFPARAGDPAAPAPAIIVGTPSAAQPNAPAESGATQKLVGLALGEIGLAGLVAGTFFGLRASSSWSAARDECLSSTNCPNHALAMADHDRAVSFAAASTVSLFVAAAGLTAGAILLWNASGSDASRAKVSLSPATDGRGGGLVVDGRF